MKNFIPDPTILLHPNIPKPLHGVAPRVILGNIWWDKVRQAAYASTSYRCAACGVPKQIADYHQWLEAHEIYDFDYPKGLLTFVHAVPLCHACHNYIHSGRMSMMVRSGEMQESKMENILKRGDALTKGLRRPSPPKSIAAWQDFRMEIMGFQWGPSTRNYGEWIDGQWKLWKP